MIDDCLDGKDERKEKQCVYVCACVCIIEEIKTKDSNHDNQNIIIYNFQPRNGCCSSWYGITW